MALRRRIGACEPAVARRGAQLTDEALAHLHGGCPRLKYLDVAGLNGGDLSWTAVRELYRARGCTRDANAWHGLSPNIRIEHSTDGPSYWDASEDPGYTHTD